MPLWAESARRRGVRGDWDDPVYQQVVEAR